MASVPAIPLSGSDDLLPLSKGAGPAWLRLQSWAQFLILLLLALIFLLVDHAVLWHTDVWAHVKYGQWIVEHRELPQTEAFLQWVKPPQPFQPHAWLAQVVLFETYHIGEQLAGGAPERRMAGGIELLRLLHAALVAGRFLFMALALQRLGGNWWLTLSFLLLTLALSFGNLLVLRPQVFGELCFALLLFLLSKPTPSPLAQVASMSLLVLWANLHGSFLLGLVVLIGLAGGRFLYIVAQSGLSVRTYVNDYRIRILMRIFLVSLAGVAFLNPVGPSLIWDVVPFGALVNVGYMDEWKPIEWNSYFGGAYLAILVLILLTHLTGLVVPPPAERADRIFGAFSLGQLIMLTVFAVQAYRTQRMMTWWVLLAPWLCIAPWGYVVRTLRPPAVPAKPALAPLPTVILFAAWLALPALFSGPALWFQSGKPRDLERSLHPGTPLILVRQLDRNLTKPLPLLADWLNQQAKEGFPGRIFTSETQGDFLVFALPAELAPPIYTHVHLVSPEHWALVYAVKSGLPSTVEILNRWKVNLVVVEAELHPDLRKQLHGDAAWQVVLDEFGDARKRDPRGRLFIAVRKEPLR